MSLIDDSSKATRLARAIVADIELYNDEAIRTEASSVADAIREGRALFETRVVPELHPLFDSTLRGSRLAPWAGEASVTAPAPIGPEPTRSAPEPIEPMPDAPQAPPAERGSITGPVIGLILILLLVAAALAYFTQKH